MSTLWDRVSFQDDGPRVGRRGVTVAEVVECLGGGESWADLVRSADLEPADLVAALAADALGGDGSLGPSLTQSSPKHPRLLPALSEPALAAAGIGTSRPARLALAAGLLQLHDFWDASHHAAQDADDLGERATSAYWHGIAHRREPDAGNAAYWFRRVGRHPLFATLAAEASRIAGSDEATFASFGSAWNPMALIELCTGARPGTARESIARKLQRIEMLRLLEASAAASGLS